MTRTMFKALPVAALITEGRWLASPACRTGQVWPTSLCTAWRRYLSATTNSRRIFATLHGPGIVHHRFDLIQGPGRRGRGKVTVDLATDRH